MESQAYERTTTRSALPEIGGRTRVPCGDGVLKRNLAPGQRPSEDAQVVTPHPILEGWRIEWIFLPIAGIVALIAAYPWLSRLAGIALIALPLWVLR